MTDSSVHSSSNNSSGKDGSISNTSGVTFSTNKTPEELMAEDKLVKYSRYCVALTLLISAATLSIVCYFAFRNEEEKHFHGEVRTLLYSPLFLFRASHAARSLTFCPMSLRDSRTQSSKNSSTRCTS